MSTVVDRRRAKMPALKPTLEALAADWTPLVAPRAVNLAALARSIFAEQRRGDSAWSVATRAPARIMLDGDAETLRALLAELIVPAWRSLAHYGGGHIEVGEVASAMGKVYFVHDECSCSAGTALPCPEFSCERTEALERAAVMVRSWGGRFSWIARHGVGYTVLFTGANAR